MNGAEKLQHQLESNGAEQPVEAFPLNRERATEGVAERLEQLLGSLEEALVYYKEVTLPDGSTVEAHNNHEKILSRAQVYRDGVSALVEQMQGQNNYYGERAARTGESAVSHLVEYLSVITDLRNQAERNPAAAKLAQVLGTIALELLPQDAGQPGKAH
jgi:hypothetical protein